MFFCLSGFLVTGSALRLESITLFMLFRILRLIPALMVEVTLSAFILGPIVTRYNLGAYFSNPLTYKYFGNIFAQLSFALPGVFVHHPTNFVNLNLWTLVPEYYCYGIVMLMFIFGLFHNRKYFLLCFLQAGAIFFLLDKHEAWTDGPVNQYLLIYASLLGTLAYLYADYVPIHKYLFILNFSLAILFFCFKETAALGVLCTAYCTIFLGMVKFPRIPFLERGDYSYGVYLYGFPITQTIWHYAPNFRTGYVLFGLAALYA